MIKGKLLFGMGLVVSLAVNVALICRGIDRAVAMDDLASQGAYQQRALVAGLAAMRAHLVGREREFVLDFCRSAELVCHDKMEEVGAGGYLVAMEEDVVVGIGPLVW